MLPGNKVCVNKKVQRILP